MPDNHYRNSSYLCCKALLISTLSTVNYCSVLWQFLHRVHYIYFFNPNLQTHGMYYFFSLLKCHFLSLLPLWDSPSNTYFKRERLIYSKHIVLFRISSSWCDGSQIDPSWWTHWDISSSSQCSTTSVTKVVVCAILSVGWCIQKNHCC